jgi:uncharacterized protein (DUF58 family)
MRPRPTARGWGLTVAGAGLVLVGILTGSLDMVRIGLLAAAVVVGAGAVVSLTSPARSRRRLDVTRRIQPNPVHAGESAEVEVEVRAGDAGSRAQLAGLRFSEQAAGELSGGRPLRARVERAPDHVVVRYTVHATRRGRWPLGPLVVTRGDAFGVVHAPSMLGETAEVAVWPTVTALSAPSDVLVGEPDRVALGARTPSTDDAALREYREGDDLRRVHWRSSARRGRLLVRSDERAGLRPVSVLLDLPARPAAVEHTVSLAASVALAMLDNGHPVRLVGIDATEQPSGPAVTPSYQHARTGPTARATLLDQLLDLDLPRTEQEAERRLVSAVHVLETSDQGGDLVIAVLGPLSEPTRRVLARLTQSAHGWALVRGDSRQPGEAAATEQTIRALRRAGWRATRMTSGEPTLTAWMRLLGSLE